MLPTALGMTPEATTSDDLRAEFAPLFQRIAENARAREAERILPFAEVRLLKEAGFGALRLAASDGGRGATLEQFFHLLIELGAADSNFPQIWRNHIAFVEDHRAGDAGKRWRGEIAAGKLFGGAWTERGGDGAGEIKTTVTPANDGYRLNGTKYYSTGSIYSDWVHVTAKNGSEEDRTLVLVESNAPGVRLVDDWTGVGQRLTGSGTAEFSDVAVPETHLYPFKSRAPYQQVVYQLVHLATLAGIARAAHHDVVAALRERRRASRLQPERAARDDPQYQAVVGRVGALASSAEASVLWAARHVDPVADARHAGAPPETVMVLARRAAVAVYEAQLTVTDAALEAATSLFDALGGSALDQSALLDRHWRNARTITSHNPRVFKARMLGDFYLNGADPLGKRNSAETEPTSAAPESEADARANHADPARERAATAN